MQKRAQLDITNVAEEDIISVWDKLAESDRSAANEFIEDLKQKIFSLEYFHNRCGLIPEYDLLGVDYKQIVSGDYRVIFRQHENVITILRVLDGTRLLDSDDFEKSSPLTYT